ncbi:multidrug DMT transporter permease [Caballeronia sordidicola]|uniref:Multidrug DMT transporter permease n=1 Tax=Caballeronia sordidicola TaxID=196367 RepID=A0A158GP23_CABSO|nr:DMT family transporter [Caballeronia sordidicola]SAL33673.1 multidrug DMT transporter permease [Caballeronia sordidicola]
MVFIKTALAAYGSTALFVLLWSSGAIVSETGLQHASALPFLVLRFALASAVLAALGTWRGRWLPAPGTRLQVAFTGGLLTGGYSTCYLLALNHGITPGVLATILGVQPVLTLLLVERRWTTSRVSGLLLALSGLCLVMLGAGKVGSFPIVGLLFASASLGCMTFGAILQKRVKQQPIDVLPLQNAVSLMLCVMLLPLQPSSIALNTGLLLPLLWLGIVISVFAQLLFYRLVRAGNLVDVTSLFYLVPVFTAIMDYAFLGNRLAPDGVAGMGSILAGLVLVFRATPAQRR